MSDFAGNLPVTSTSGAASASDPTAVRLTNGTSWISPTTPSDTQPVSAASLPLPTGAATETTLAAVKVDVDKLTFTSARLLVDGSGVTQPISGSVSVGNFPASQAVTGTFWQATQPVSGTFWQATQPVSGTFFQATQPVSGTVTANQGGTWTVQPGNTANTTAWKVDGSAVTQPVSGTVTVQQSTAANLKIDLSGTAANATAIKVDNSAVVQPASQSGTWTVQPGNTANSTAWLVNGPALTKGTQGANGLTIQELKDAGRSYLSFTANAAAGVTAEALISFSQNKQGVVTAGVSSYVVTSGKTLRITSISYSVKSAAAAIAFSKIILRHNTAGATIATSPVAYICPEINTNSATSGTSAFITVPIPDGIEFFGNGTQTIGMSHLDQATTNILNITVYGFEY